MMGLVYIALSIVVLGLVCYFYERKRRHEEDISIPEEPKKTSEERECCGQHLICEKESLLAGASQEIVYYDDEELDRYAGHPSDGYTADEIGEFEEVFYTLAPTDVAGWVRSLQLRNIALPDELKVEVLLVVGEQRSSSAGK
ncbi:MAG: phospholipase [Porphyromonadaceae bacterium]|nr:phospholipase [Porphyromonadaceae bacterium]